MRATSRAVYDSLMFSHHGLLHLLCGIVQVWVVGSTQVYQLALRRVFCHRLSVNANHPFEKQFSSCGQTSRQEIDNLDFCFDSYILPGRVLQIRELHLESLLGNKSDVSGHTSYIWHRRWRRQRFTDIQFVSDRGLQEFARMLQYYLVSLLCMVGKRWQSFVPGHWEY